LTRNSSLDLFEYKSSANLQKKKIFDAIAAASIVSNCAGVDTSKSQVITLATFVKFLETRQMEQHTEDEVKALIQVSELPSTDMALKTNRIFALFVIYVIHVWIHLKVPRTFNYQGVI
jgi:phosphatidylinositol phospholipase C epsilon